MCRAFRAGQRFAFMYGSGHSPVPANRKAVSLVTFAAMMRMKIADKFITAPIRVLFRKPFRDL